MYLNELDNFHFDLPSLGTAPQVAVPNEAPDELDLSALPLPTTPAVPGGGAGVPGGGGEVLPEGSVEDYPQIGSLSPADTELFKGVIAKYFAEDISSYEAPSRVVPSHASTAEGGDDVEPEKKNCLLKDNGFGIGIPETDDQQSRGSPSPLRGRVGERVCQWLWHWHSRDGDCQEPSVRGGGYGEHHRNP